jgi:DNA-directed RNA polymerase subunit H (RpoH/RPB5)
MALDIDEYIKRWNNLLKLYRVEPVNPIKKKDVKEVSLEKKEKYYTYTCSYVDPRTVGYEHKTGTERKWVIFFCGSIRKGTLKHMLDKYQGWDHLTFIYTHTTRSISSALNRIRGDRQLTDQGLIQYCEELTYNQISPIRLRRFKHVLVPEYKLMVDKSAVAAELNREMDTLSNTLPRMLHEDVVPPYFGFQKGDIIRCTSRHHTTYGVITYRVIWPPPPT